MTSPPPLPQPSSAQTRSRRSLCRRSSPVSDDRKPACPSARRPELVQPHSPTYTPEHHPTKQSRHPPILTSAASPRHLSPVRPGCPCSYVSTASASPAPCPTYTATGYSTPSAQPLLPASSHTTLTRVQVETPV
ncbi:hypothetical protein J5N97_013530 [Dioscorea zingiberensis]|uniref:Uncharacterized protein n=1 Tax=Dioscorea zingiberensis TaxID=325984 RepID=A0A9D5CQY1_9LILI|nr:hypothetical protein J5N97_013530 [Dioscorea zingiberensis]